MSLSYSPAMPETLEKPDLHPETGEPTRIVVARFGPLLAHEMRVGAREAAHGEGRTRADMKLAKDIAAQWVGERAEAHLGRVLIGLIDKGTVSPEAVLKLGQAHREFVALCEGVHSGKPSPVAVQTANRIVSPEGLIEMSGDGYGGQLVILAYTVLQLDQERVLDGGVL